MNDNIYEQCQVGLNKFVVESAPVVSLFDSSLFIVTKKKKTGNKNNSENKYYNYNYKVSSLIPKKQDSQKVPRGLA